MGILSDFRDRLDLAKGVFAVNPGNFVREKAKSLFQPIWSTPPRRSTAQWLDLVMKSPRTDPLHKIASDVAATPYKLYIKNTKPKKEITNHISLNLLDKPCSDTTVTKQSLLYLTELYQLSPAGEAFWLLERNGFGVPSEIWVVPPHWVQSVPTQTIPYFKILPQGNTSYQMIYADPNDVIWFKSPDPTNPYGRGRGRAEAIGDELETDEYMAKWQKSKFFNGAIPSYIGTMPGADETTIDRAEEAWNRKYGGAKSGHKTAFLNWDAKITKLSDNEQEMDYIASRKFLRDTCLQHYNMSGELFGILENANRSTIDLAYELYAKNTLSVRLKSFDDTLNRQFFPQFDEKIIIEHDNVVPTDREFELKKATEGLKNGGIVVDEWRETNGYDKLPDGKGNILYTPLNMMPTDINSESIIDNSPMSDEKPKSKALKDAVDDKKKRIWKMYDLGARKYERKLVKDMKKYFAKQENKVITNLQKSISNSNQKDISDNPDDLIVWKLEMEELKKLLLPYWIASGEEGFNITSDLYNLDIEFDGINGIVKPELVEWMNTQGAENIVNITNTTKEGIRLTLAEGLIAGESTLKLINRVKDVFKEASTTRAKLIAENETMASLSNGNFQTMKAAGFEKHEWLTAGDGAVRDTHLVLNGQVRKIGEPFSNGLLHPHDPNGPAKETIHCRCITVISEEEV